MSRGARRLQRRIGFAAPVDNTVVFYTGANYMGTAIPASQGDSVNTLLPQGQNDTIRSIKVLAPSKVYTYSDVDYSGSIFFTTHSIPNLSTFYDNGSSFSAATSSYRVESAAYAAPTAAIAPITLNDATTVVAWPGSGRFGDCVINQVNTDIQDQAVYDDFTAIMPAYLFQPALQQMARNVCSIIYDNPDSIPRSYPTMTLHFMPADGIAASAGGHVWLYKQAPLYPIASFMSHEICHNYQCSKDYGTSPYATGVIEGVADYVLVIMGYHTVRPSGGGTNWYDGYDTSAFFFDYIENHAAVPSPGFVKRLVRTMDGRDPLVSNFAWAPSIIQTINAQGKTVDQLWADYKAWVAAGN